MLKTQLSLNERAWITVLHAQFNVVQKTNMLVCPHFTDLKFVVEECTKASCHVTATYELWYLNITLQWRHFFSAGFTHLPSRRSTSFCNLDTVLSASVARFSAYTHIETSIFVWSDITLFIQIAFNNFPPILIYTTEVELSKKLICNRSGILQ